VAHLIIIERAIISASDQMLQPGKTCTLYKAVSCADGFCGITVWSGGKTPIPQGGEFIGTKEACCELRDVRERTLAFMDETKAKDLSVVPRSHAFLGH